jgi:hypothetical protein
VPQKSRNTAGEERAFYTRSIVWKKRGRRETVTFDDDIDDIRLVFERMNKSMNVEKFQVPTVTPHQLRDGRGVFE